MIDPILSDTRTHLSPRAMRLGKCFREVQDIQAKLSVLNGLLESIDPHLKRLVDLRQHSHPDEKHRPPPEYVLQAEPSAR